MAGSVHDSQIYHKLFDAGEASKLFTDSAEVRAMLIVVGALAKAQGELGIIPELSAKAIHRATLEIPLDPGALGQAAAVNGVPVYRISLARREPAARGRFCVPPQPGMMPRVTSVRANRALSAA